MKKFLILAMLAVPAFAATRGTPAEAKAMLAKAVAHYKKVGRWDVLAKRKSARSSTSGSIPSRRMEPKISFFEKVASDLACGVGAYNPLR